MTSRIVSKWLGLYMEWGTVGRAITNQHAIHHIRRRGFFRLKIPP
jgi:hypothetical protein